jgi:RNA polymerase sigma-70 factor (ECF subfamily)
VSDVERVFREEYGRAVAVLTRVFGDIGMAEDAVQDAFTIAAARWPQDGLPPAWWIITPPPQPRHRLLRREASPTGTRRPCPCRDEPVKPAGSEEDAVHDDRCD